MKLILSALVSLFKIGVLACLLVILLAAVLWGLERAGLVTLQVPAPRDASVKEETHDPANASPDSATTEAPTSDPVARPHAPREAVDGLAGHGKALAEDAERAYDELRHQVDRIISSRESDGPRRSQEPGKDGIKTDTENAGPAYSDLRDQVDRVIGSRGPRIPRRQPWQAEPVENGQTDNNQATEKQSGIVPDAPDYNDLRRQLAQIGTARPAPEPPAATPSPSVADATADAPDYRDLKRRLASALK